MKTVYSTSEIAHLWAHQKQSNARNQQHNFFFEGEVIYSYGHHFPCGKIVYNVRGEKAYVLNPNKYSNTTSGHQWLVSRALSDSCTRFNSPDCFVPSVYKDKKNCYTDFNNVLWYMAYHLNNIAEYIKKQAKARVSNYIPLINSEIREMRNYIAFYGFDKPKNWALNKYLPKEECLFKRIDVLKWFLNKRNINVLKKKINKDMNYCVVAFEIFATLQQYSLLTGTAELTEAAINQIIPGFCANESKRLEEVKKLAKKKVQIIIKDDLHNLKKWHNGEIRYWSASCEFFKNKMWHTALRINGNLIETSKGIVLGLEEAKRLWKLVKLFHEGTEFKHDLAVDRNGEKWVLNQYEKDILTAGCHVIPFSECERIAKLLNW